MPSGQGNKAAIKLIFTSEIYWPILRNQWLVILPHSAQRKDSIHRMAEEGFKTWLKNLPPAPRADPPKGMDCISSKYCSETTSYELTIIELSSFFPFKKFTSKLCPFRTLSSSTFSNSALDVL